MRNLFAAIVIAGAVALPAWGQGMGAINWRASPDPSVYPRSAVRAPTSEEQTTARKENGPNDLTHPTLGERVFEGYESYPGQALLQAERLQAYLGEQFEVTPVRTGKIWDIFARPKKGAPDIVLDSNIWSDVENVARRTDAVGVRARYYGTPREVDFRGGTLDQFLTLMLPETLDLELVYLPPEVRNIPIAPVRIKSVNPWPAIRLVERLYSSEFSFEFLGARSKGNVSPEGTTLVITGSPAMLARQRSSGEPSVVRLPPASATSDSARREQEHLQDGILRAIADGIALRGGPSSNFKLKLNPSTGILFVLGTAEEQELVRGVARAMMPEGARANDADAVSNPPAATQSANAPSAPPAAPPSESEIAKPRQRPKPPAPTP